MLHGIGLADVFAALANHHRQFGFVVDLLGHGSAGQVHIICGADHALGHFGEHNGPSLGVGIAVLEDRGLQLFGMRVVIAAHAPHVATGQGQRRLELDRGQGQGRTTERGQGLARDHGFNDGLGSTLALGLCHRKRRDEHAVGRNLTHLAFAHVNKCGDAQNNLLNTCKQGPDDPGNRSLAQPCF